MKPAAGILGYMAIAGIAVLPTIPGKPEIARSPFTLEADSAPGSGPAIATRDDDEDDFVPYQGERVSLFDWSLFKAASRNATGNLLLSPISLKIALILLFEGAQDETAHELAAALQLPATRPAVRDRYSSILRSLQTVSPATYTFNMGTRIYVDSSLPIRQRYRAVVKTFYDADVVDANLSDAGPVAAAINRWVSNVTAGRIERMIEDESGIEKSVMLVMNALYFQGSWRRKYFAPENTRIGQFRTTDGRTVDAAFMNAYARFYYSESPEFDAKILRIPYTGNKFAMYILLPRTLDGIGQLVDNVNPFVLSRHVWLMQDLLVNVTIPKFQFHSSNHLEPVLRQLGIRDIFDDTATLTGIARTKQTSRRLKVSDIVQRAGIEVNENGTMAYAATEIDIGNKIEDQTFHADRPFVFYIEDESMGTIVHVGRIMNPLDTAASSTGTTSHQSPSKFGPPLPDPGSILQPGLNTEDRNNLFATHFSQALNREYRDGNLVSSPTSVKAALSMVLEGADGDTKSELVAALRLPEDETRRRDITQRGLASLKRNESGTEIDFASRLWLDRSLRVLDSYRDVLESRFHGDITSVNFADPQSTANLMNDWVRRVTRDAVSSVPLLTDIKPDTRLILTSAIYFKGRWKKAFDKANTKLQCFYAPNGECRNMLFMKHESIYRYAYIPSIDAHVLEIPYADNKTSMLTLMPSSREKDPYLRILSEDLANVPVSAILANLQMRDVTVHLPKFSIENDLNLTPTLQRLNVGNIFLPNTNLTRMIANGPVHVTSVFQNVKIEVDEEGALAASSTEIGYEFLSSFGNDVTFDRPFLFMVVDTVTSTPLFVGRFVEPL